MSLQAHYIRLISPKHFEFIYIAEYKNLIAGAHIKSAWTRSR